MPNYFKKSDKQHLYQTNTPPNPGLSNASIRNIAIILCVLVIGIIIFLILNQKPAVNPYGPEIPITNFSDFFSDVPDDRRNNIYSSLYTAASEHNESIPNGTTASVRSTSKNYTYDQATDVHYGTFIADIPTLRQSYNVYFEWSQNPQNLNLSGYQIVITCPKASELIYENFGCSDSFTEADKETETLNKEFPLYRLLPLNFSYYLNGNGRYVKYMITGQLQTENGKTTALNLTITDYSGGNYELALQKIRALGYNPNDYKIEYIDKSKTINP